MLWDEPGHCQMPVWLLLLGLIRAGKIPGQAGITILVEFGCNHLLTTSAAGKGRNLWKIVQGRFSFANGSVTCFGYHTWRRIFVWWFFGCVLGVF